MKTYSLDALNIGSNKKKAATIIDNNGHLKMIGVSVIGKIIIIRIIFEAIVRIVILIICISKIRI